MGYGDEDGYGSDGYGGEPDPETDGTPPTPTPTRRVLLMGVG
jgi:hypothetical protein